MNLIPRADFGRLIGRRRVCKHTINTDDTLTPSDKRVGVHLLECCNFLEARPIRQALTENIAAALGVDKRTVHRAFARLRERGYFDIHPVYPHQVLPTGTLARRTNQVFAPNLEALGVRAGPVRVVQNVSAGRDIAAPQPRENARSRAPGSSSSLIPSVTVIPHTDLRAVAPPDAFASAEPERVCAKVSEPRGERERPAPASAPVVAIADARVLLMLSYWSRRLGCARDSRCDLVVHPNDESALRDMLARGITVDEWRLIVDQALTDDWYMAEGFEQRRTVNFLAKFGAPLLERALKRRRREAQRAAADEREEQRQRELAAAAPRIEEPLDPEEQRSNAERWREVLAVLGGVAS